MSKTHVIRESNSVLTLHSLPTVFVKEHLMKTNFPRSQTRKIKHVSSACMLLLQSLMLCCRGMGVCKSADPESHQTEEDEDLSVSRTERGASQQS